MIQVDLTGLMILLDHLLVEEFLQVYLLFCHLVKVQILNDPLSCILRREFFKLELPVRVLLIFVFIKTSFCEVFVYLTQEYTVFIALKVTVCKKLATLFNQFPVFSRAMLLACVF